MSNRVSVELAGTRVRAWECKCGQQVFHPLDTEKALEANKLRAGVRLKIGLLNNAPYVRFTKEFSSVLHKGAQAVASLVAPNEIRLRIGGR